MSLPRFAFRIVGFISLSLMLFAVKTNAQQTSGISVSPKHVVIQEGTFNNFTISLNPPFPHQQVNVNLIILQPFGFKMQNGQIFYPVRITDRFEFTTSPLNPGFARIGFFANWLPQEFKQFGLGSFLIVNARTSSNVFESVVIPIEIFPYQQSDRRAPNINLLSPHNRQEINRYSALTIRVDAKDDLGGILRVDFYFDNKLIGSSNITDFDGFYSMPIPAPIEPGIHMIHVIAHDFLFNFTVSNVILVTVL